MKDPESACFRDNIKQDKPCTRETVVGITHFHHFDNAAFIARINAGWDGKRWRVSVDGDHFTITPTDTPLPEQRIERDCA